MNFLDLDLMFDHYAFSPKEVVVEADHDCAERMSRTTVT